MPGCQQVLPAAGAKEEVRLHVAGALGAMGDGNGCRPGLGYGRGLEVL